MIQAGLLSYSLYIFFLKSSTKPSLSSARLFFLNDFSKIFDYYDIYKDGDIEESVTIVKYPYLFSIICEFCVALVGTPNFVIMLTVSEKSRGEVKEKKNERFYLGTHVSRC